MRCSCGITYESSRALIAHITDDHLDEAPEEFVEEWLAA